MTVRTIVRGLGAAMALAIAAAPIPAMAQAQSPEEFFRGKTVTVNVASGTGGGYALYARLMANHIGRLIPGNPRVITTYMPGSGGLRAANYLYNSAPQDGTALGSFVSPVQVNQFVSGDAVRYDANKFHWIGVATAIRPVLHISRKAGIASLADLRSKELAAGASGIGSPTFLVPTLANLALGAKIKIVKGYKGTADLNLAMERGEVQAITMPWGSVKSEFPHLLTNAVQLFQYGLTRDPEHADLPLIHEIATDPRHRKLVRFLASETALGRNLVAPPGLPADRVAVLRKAFDDMMKDDAFLAEAKKSRAELEPISGEKIQAMIREFSQTDPETIELAKQVLGDK